MVYYSSEAITLRILRSLPNRPIGRHRIHKDGQSLLLLWRTVRLRSRHKASRATNGKGSTWACTSDTTVRLTTLEGVLHAKLKACMGGFE